MQPESKGWTLDTLKGMSSKVRKHLDKFSYASSKPPVYDIGSVLSKNTTHSKKRKN